MGFTRGRVRELKNSHNSVTVQNRTHVYMNFFDHKDLGNHLLHLFPKVVKHPVYMCANWICIIVNALPWPTLNVGCPCVQTLTFFTGIPAWRFFITKYCYFGRMYRVLRTVQCCGDYDRLTQGVYENFLNMSFRDSRLEAVRCKWDTILVRRFHTPANRLCVLSNILYII